MEKLEFIELIAPLAQKAYKELGKVKPSVCIGMACVECAYGRAGSVRHNSLLGQKVGTGRTATKYWNKAFFNSTTKEEYTVGVHTIIKSAFRAYDSFEQCIYNYYELLNTSLYKKVLASSPYDEQMRQIKEAGYMTSSTEVMTVLSIIKQYNLTKYDDIYTKVETVKPAEHIEKSNDLYTEYKVVRGDSLWRIAERFYGKGVYWTKIYSYNNLTSNIIKVGQIIKVPKEV